MPPDLIPAIMASMNLTLTYTIKKQEAGRTAADFLRDQGYSGRILVQLRKTSGAILINGLPAFSNRTLAEGDILTVLFPEEPCSEGIVPVPMELSVLYEDDFFMAVNKPAGMPVHPSLGHYENTLANGIAWYMKERGIPFTFRAVNRLDRDTSGLLLIAKNRLASCLLSAQAASHNLHREYSAIVCGKTEPSGTVSAPIARKEGSILERTVDFEHGEAAVTHYVRMAYKEDADLSFLRLKLSTGRTHQIRVHMKYIGHPIPGDFLYCPDYSVIKRQALHSSRLSFVHPVTKAPMEFEAPLPDDMKALFPEMAYGCLSPFG